MTDGTGAPDAVGSARPPVEPSPRATADLARAVEQLRARPHQHAVEIADGVLRRALRAPRRAELIGAAAPYEYLRVSTTALTAALRDRLDAMLPDAAVGRVVFDVSPDHRLERLLVELHVRYGSDILRVGDQTRVVARAVLTDSLGAADAAIAVTHVHVSDVTRGDPHLSDPSDPSDPSEDPAVS